MKRKGELRVIVVGAGMSGILCGIRLKQEGIGHVTIYEKGDRAGGTWRETPTRDSPATSRPTSMPIPSSAIRIGATSSLRDRRSSTIWSAPLRNSG